MSSYALALIFIFELALALGLVWLWMTVRDRLKNLEQRLSESLDDQDLVDFQERVSGLLTEVKDAGQSMASQIEQRRAGLDREMSRARETEKRLALKLQSADKAQEKAKAKIEEWVEKLGKKASKDKVGKKGEKRPASSQPIVQSQAPIPAVPQPLKVSYLSREFRAPEAQAPILSTSNRYLKVYEMSDQGFSHGEIAKACGYLPGEVELILNLRPRPRG